MDDQNNPNQPSPNPTFPLANPLPATPSNNSNLDPFPTPQSTTPTWEPITPEPPIQSPENPVLQPNPNTTEPAWNPQPSAPMAEPPAPEPLLENSAPTSVVPTWSPSINQPTAPIPTSLEPNLGSIPYVNPTQEPVTQQAVIENPTTPTAIPTFTPTDQPSTLDSSLNPTGAPNSQPNMNVFPESSTLNPAPQFTAEPAPTDLSQLSGAETQPPPEMYTPPVSNNENLIIPTSQPSAIPENLGPQDPKKSIMPILLIIGGVIVLLVAAASAYFILGIGNPSTTETTSLPSQQAPLTNPPRQVVQPTAAPAVEATDSASFGSLNGTSEGSTTSSKPASALEAVRQRQQPSPSPTK